MVKNQLAAADMQYTDLLLAACSDASCTGAHLATAAQQLVVDGHSRHPLAHASTLLGSTDAQHADQVCMTAYKQVSSWLMRFQMVAACL